MRLFKFSISIFLILFLFTGCPDSDKEKSKDSQQSQESGNKQEKVPEELEKTEESLEKILKLLKGPSSSKMKEEEMDLELNSKKQEENTSDKNQDGKQSNSDDSKQSEEDSKDKSSESKDNKQGNEENNKKSSESNMSKEEAAWESINPIINTLHYQCNELVPKVAKAGANQTLLANFNNSLNALTNTIIEKNKNKTMLAANELYGYLPDFYALYPKQSSPELKRLRYFARNAVLNSYVSNWNQVDLDINNLKSTWNILKNTLNEEQMDISRKLDFSISEFENITKEKNQPVTDIKGRIVLSNIDALEESASQSSESQGSDSTESKDKESE